MAEAVTYTSLQDTAEPIPTRKNREIKHVLTSTSRRG